MRTAGLGHSPLTTAFGRLWRIGLAGEGPPSLRLAAAGRQVAKADFGRHDGVARRVLLSAILGALPVIAAVSRGAQAADKPVMIFAAATLKPALDPAAHAAGKAVHVPITTVYGPTPALVKQLENGAPADIFFSADADWMDDAVARKLVDPATRVDLLSSTLVLIAPADEATPVTIVPGFPLATMLGGGRLAMCDPMMMPAGRYGRAALQKLGVWPSVQDHVANAADVLTAVTYVSRHEAALGIVFDTDARLAPGVTVVGTFPPDTHPPIVYPIAAVARSSNPATPLVLAFLRSAAARAIFAAHGFTVLPAT
jgi:molybdate transport system substrate-binding protein